MRGLVLTFYNAAFPFVTSRRQNRGGNGGRAPVYFFPEAASEGIGGNRRSAAAVQFRRHVLKSLRQ
jgi:hypothetical protein